MKKSGIAVILSLLLGLFCLTGCQEKKANLSPQVVGEDKKIVVYTSFYPMYDFTKKIGGNKVEVNNMIPSGVEPHEWEPTTKDITNLNKAQIFIYSGAGMEGWVNKVIEALNNEKLVTVEASKGISYLANKDKDEPLEYDPHTWLSPLNVKIQMKNIKNALQKVDPANKDYYEKNFLDNVKKLDQLDQEYKKALADYKGKEIIVAHQAFGYLCQAYGLKQMAIEGLSADSEPTPTRMAEVTKFAKEHKVKYIFFEDLISPKVAQIIAKQAGAKTEMLNPLEGLSQEDIQAGKEYFSVMKDNLIKLQKALE